MMGNRLVRRAERADLAVAFFPSLHWRQLVN
jgi:hypothetical protein